MKKYLREIEISGLILTVIGCLMASFVGYQYGMWPCGIGLLLFLIVFLYKAFHWKEYERDNKQNIIIVLICIVLLFIQMLRAR